MLPSPFFSNTAAPLPTCPETTSGPWASAPSLRDRSLLFQGKGADGPPAGGETAEACCGFRVPREHRGNCSLKLALPGKEQKSKGNSFSCAILRTKGRQGQARRDSTCIFYNKLFKPLHKSFPTLSDETDLLSFDSLLHLSKVTATRSSLQDWSSAPVGSRCWREPGP